MGWLWGGVLRVTHRATEAHRVLNVVSSRKNRSPKLPRKNISPTTVESRECLYCHEPGHLITVCPVLKRKDNKTGKPPAGVGFINTVSTPEENVAPLPDPQASAEVDARFKPFLSSGFVSITAESEKVLVTIL